MKKTLFFNPLLLFIVIVITNLVNGCANQPNKTVVKQQEQQTVVNVSFGKVSEVNEVMLAGKVSPIGGTTAGVLGRVAGASAGGSSGAAVQILATLGGMVGSILGSSAEEAMTREKGLEIYVVLDDTDEMIRVVQTAEVPFEAGDAVKVIENGSKSHVEHQ